MKEGIIKLRLAKKSGKIVTELYGEGNPRILQDIKEGNFQVDREYDVLFHEEYIDNRANKKRLTVYYQNKLIYDSCPDLAPLATEQKTAEFEVLQKSVVLQKEKPSMHSKHVPQETQKKPTVNKDKNPLHVENISFNRTARAPYNFIPLPDKNPVLAEKPTGVPCDFNVYHHPDCKTGQPDHKTGWIELEIETMTPIYIRDTMTKEELEKYEKDGIVNPDFFSPSGKPQIPGSTIRGLIRNMVEMVSFGNLGFFDDEKRLYFRGLADKSNLRQEYQKKMTSYDSSDKSIYNAFAGVMRRKGFGFEIIRSDKEQISKSVAQNMVKRIGERYQDFRFYKFDNEGKYLVVSGPMKNKKKDWLIKFPPWFRLTEQYLEELKIKNVPESIIDLLKKLKNQEYKDEKQFVEALKNTMGEENTESYKLIILNRAKFFSENSGGISIPQEDVRSYRDDATRYGNENRNKNNTKDAIDKVPDLIKLIKEKKDDGQYKYEEVPCFYVLWQDNKGNQRVSFGHTAMFRLAYERTIGDHVPEEFKDKKNIDIAEAIFGNEKEFMGRVFFEDAFLAEGQEDVLLEEGTTKILSSPKPTTFQHYLVQTCEDVKELNHYNSENALIRGNKLYWHKAGKEWEQKDKNEIKKYKKQYINLRIKPVKGTQSKSTKFTGRIRFENFSLIELGALLFALDLPQGCYHKIGMGKPLGLGSIRITPRLFLSDRAKRYSSLFEEWENPLSESEEIPELKREFEEYVLKGVGEIDKTSLWDTNRLKELKTMLHFQTGLDLEAKGATKYMEILGINEFRYRRILPKPTEVARILPKKITQVDKIIIKDLWGKKNLNVNWSLYPNVNILIGINGTGKSTILKLLATVLKSKHEYQEKNRNHPSKLGIFFNDKERIEYKGKDQVTGTEYQIESAYISTFDIEAGSVDGFNKKHSDFIDTHLTQQLDKAIDNFANLAEKINSEDFQEKKEKLIQVINNLFNDTHKIIEFRPKLEFSDSALQSIAEDTQIPNDISSKMLDILKLRKEFVPDKAFESTLEKSKISKDLIDKYTPLVRTYGTISQAVYPVFYQEDGTMVRWDELSAGEKQVLIILLTVSSLEKDLPSILIMDEPEISLHLEWQEELIKIITEIKKDIQIIVATHSPSIPFKYWAGHLTDIASIVNLDT